MEREKVVRFLDKYDYKYSGKNNVIFVKLDLSQQVQIKLDQPNKIIIKDKLIAWNFLTGMIQMSLKNALIYNFIGAILFGLLCLFSDENQNGLNGIALFLVYITWIVLFSGYYITKLESFKNQLIYWTKE